MPLVFVVMGVSGCGKSTVGALLAERLGCPFYEGDAFHPAANVAKMQAGTPLSDDDRWPWLQQLAGIVQRHLAAGQPAVLSCSALKPAYRALLRTGRRSEDDGGGSSGCSSGGGGSRWAEDSRVAFVLLDPPREVLERRLVERATAGAHFMPASLLDSQLAALQWEEGELFLRVAPGGGGEAWPQARQVVDAIARHLPPGGE